MPKQIPGDEMESIRQQLGASYALSGYLLEAQSEEAVISAAMKISTELLGAEGSAFVPFSEWKRTVPALDYGEAKHLKKVEWQELLYAPATRYACRICSERQGDVECVLLQGLVDTRNIYCVGLRCSGREIGVVSYFFSVLPKISADQRQFLAEMVRLTDLALVALQSHAQAGQGYRLAQSPLELKENLIALDEKNVELLEQLEYKAILEERTRLAREIHDGLAQTLAFLKLEAARMQAYISKGDVEALSLTLQACQKTLSDAYLDARQAIDNLRRVPDEVLSDWLELTAIDFTTLTGIEVDVSNVRVQHVFSPSVKAQLIRIVQEALTNIRKHAQACGVKLSAFERDATVFLEVRDNGRGFSPEETQPASQYGLRSMRERAESIGADFQIISTPGGGTTVRLRIPIREKASQ
jgi:signal transduction histidine kinase